MKSCDSVTNREYLCFCSFLRRVFWYKQTFPSRGREQCYPILVSFFCFWQLTETSDMWWCRHYNLNVWLFTHTCFRLKVNRDIPAISILLSKDPLDSAEPGYVIIIFFLSYLSRSLADRWGTTVDFTTSFLHCSWFSAFRSVMFHWRPVHSLMLSSHRFLCLPLRLPPWTVPCRIVLASPDDRVTCPYHFSLRLFTIIIIMIIIIALKGANQDFCNLFTTPRTVSNTYAQVARAQSCATRVQNMERLSYHEQHVCHMAWGDSSAVKFDRVEMVFVLVLLHWLKPLTDECVSVKMSSAMLSRTGSENLPLFLHTFMITVYTGWDFNKRKRKKEFLVIWWIAQTVCIHVVVVHFIFGAKLKLWAYVFGCMYVFCSCWGLLLLYCFYNFRIQAKKNFGMYSLHIRLIKVLPVRKKFLYQTFCCDRAWTTLISLTAWPKFHAQYAQQDID